MPGRWASVWHQSAPVEVEPESDCAATQRGRDLAHNEHSIGPLLALSGRQDGADDSHRMGGCVHDLNFESGYL